MAGVSARFQLMFWSSDVVGCPLCVCVWCGLGVCGLRRVCVDGAFWCDRVVTRVVPQIPVHLCMGAAFGWLALRASDNYNFNYKYLLYSR